MITLLIAAAIQPTQLDRIEALLNQIINTKAQETRQVIQYEQCTRSCIERFPFTPSEANNGNRETCFKACDTDKPPGYVGC